MNRLLAPTIAPLLLIALAACKERPASTPTPRSSGPISPAPTPAPEPAAPAAASAGTLVVAGLSFPVPENWKQVAPSNAMRLAEVQVPGPSGDPAETCIIAFSSAGGDVQSNIARWAGQIRDSAGQPATPDVQTKTIHDVKVHVAEMTGTYSGMNEAPRAGWTLRGAIIETSSGLLFVKMTGPAGAMAAAEPGFTTMIDGLNKP